MKYNVFKYMLTILLFITFLFIIGKTLRYILNDDTESYTRITYHEMYEQDNIDVLFLGPSHCMHSFDPSQLDKKLNMNTFNAASSSQALDGSLLILKEACKYSDIKQVYLDLFYNNSYDIHKERTQMTNAYIISDYLKPSADKYVYLLNASGSEHYANSFIVARRCWKKMFEPGYIPGLLKKKNTEAYRNYEYVKHENAEYAGKGYIKNLPSVKDWDFFDTWGWVPAAPETFSGDYKNDLMNIIDFCREHGIKLTLISAPTSDFCLTAIGDYDDYIAWVRSVAKENGIEYYDFNLCKEQYFPSTSEYFIDPVHLNYKGADKLADTFSELVNGKVSYDDMFYDSYGEKLNSLEPTVFGVTFMNEYADNGEIIKNCRIVSSSPETLEYRISVSPDTSDEYLLRDYSSDPSFIMDPDVTGTVTVEYRSSDGSGRINKATILTVK